MREEIELAKIFADNVRNSGIVISNKLNGVVTKYELYEIMAEYQDMLNNSLFLDPDGTLYIKIESKVSERLSNLIFKFALEEGWPFLLDLIKVYDPDNEEVIDCSTILNAISRMVILTRHKEGVEGIPVEALEYMVKFHEAPDTEWEESFVCGWGFDHPDFRFKEILEQAVEDDESIWASGILEPAFYADQKKAAAILIEFLRKDYVSNVDKMKLVQAVTFYTDAKWDEPDLLPRYWDWKRAVDYGRFRWDDEVERALKDAIEEELADYIAEGQSKVIHDTIGRIADSIPAYEIDFSKEWSLEDLGI